MPTGEIVHIVDDDEALRRTTSRILESAGYCTDAYCSGDEFLERMDAARPGCVILDVRMPGSDGLSVQDAMRARNVDWPILMLTGYADVKAAVKSLKAGAVDFLQKPYRRQQLIEAIAIAQARFADQSGAARVKLAARTRIDRLTPREAETLSELRKGLPHKIAAHNLGISVRTVEVHRAQALRKLEVRTLPEALQIFFEAA